MWAKCANRLRIYWQSYGKTQGKQRISQRTTDSAVLEWTSWKRLKSDSTSVCLLRCWWANWGDSWDSFLVDPSSLVRVLMCLIWRRILRQNVHASPVWPNKFSSISTDSRNLTLLNPSCNCEVHESIWIHVDPWRSMGTRGLGNFWRLMRVEVWKCLSVLLPSYNLL